MACRMESEATVEPSELAGQRVTVMGLGLLGGGVGVARFLAQHGAHVTVTDLKDGAALADSLAKLDGLSISFHLGGHVDGDFAEPDMLVVNPAVPDTSPFLAKARAAGVALETEINLFFKLCPAAVVGVTGSNGKSTAASLAHHLLAAGDRRAWLGGNIGRSLLEDLGEIGADDVVVLELSSFQLERLEPTGLSPAVSVVLNVAPNHLDRHGTLDAYARAKQPILLHQRPGDAAVLNADCPVVSTWGGLGQGRKLEFSVRRPVACGAWLDGDRALWRDPPSRGRRSSASCLRQSSRGCGGRTAGEVGGGPSVELFRTSGLKLRGAHNTGNALAAAAAAVLCGVPHEAIGPRLRTFRGLEHRLELVRSLDGVAYSNDSKATTPEAAAVALRAFDEPVVLIAGGYDKKLPFDEVGKAAAECARAVVLLGATAGQLRAAIAAHRADFARRSWASSPSQRRDVPTHVVADLAAAVDTARRLAQAGDVVLLSPACASYDMFANFEARGAEFKRLVMELPPCGE